MGITIQLDQTDLRYGLDFLLGSVGTLIPLLGAFVTWRLWRLTPAAPP